ncbi:hypothetical protein AMAG_18048 [Allomyces macrogynus ATCC 38327]|uniref:Ion transport domain-containing protein n=1 Tax=Allomyces macrogynus (strain ATCC 38327) TaxID=578462 RepID=A0A0L0S4J0_ALLM3|nr:hypothetical protein AMAG_18048 [Allomyces macrogynus ATCC 38327]|eukprot:KNE57432.1 hypothetical protein AMAG_18048 [Allomyces macrogynus ATCC 38327]
METITKFYVYRLAYFKSGWNNFDLVIVLTSVFSFLLPALVLSSSGGSSTMAFNPKVIRLFRVFRAFRAIRSLRALRAITFLSSLQVLVQTLLQSIPAMSSIVALAGLVLFSGTGYRVPKAPLPHEQTPTTDVARIIQESSNDPPKPFEPKPASFPVQPDTSIVDGNGNGTGAAGHATCSCGGDHAPGAHGTTLAVGAPPKKPKHLHKSTSALIADKPAKDATPAGAVAAKDAADPTKTPTTPQTNPAGLMTSIPTTGGGGAGGQGTRQ